MSDPSRAVVDNLVTQFSSPLHCFRELVQNSIDAGSGAVDIWLDFIPDEGGGASGVIEIHVDDAGEGMNEEIIDDQLTTLFSSTKEDDLTKIGKFGIGFVSVFALGPKGVLVQTGRDGEYWEVFFDHDRSFYKSPLETPIEDVVEEFDEDATGAEHHDGAELRAVGAPDDEFRPPGPHRRDEHAIDLGVRPGRPASIPPPPGPGCSGGAG